ncbi:transposase [Klebsiella aerogenes]
MDVCHKLDISYATFYIWRKKYRGISLSELKHMRQNQRLNKRITNLMPDKAMPQDELASHERKDEGNGHSKR